MAITREDGEEIKISQARKNLHASHTSAIIQPLQNVDSGIQYRTEVCSLELLFSEYIWKLIPTAESFEPGKQITSNGIDQVIYLIHLLRGWAINHLVVYIDSFGEGNDPFFAQMPVPQLNVAKEGEFNPTFVMPIGEYLQQLSARHRTIDYDPMLLTIADEFFQIAVSGREEDNGKHYLLLPDQKVLLCAARDGVLFSTGAY